MSSINQNTNPRKFLQFCVILEIDGNVNADESVGTRTLIKKFVGRDGIYPYVSSRAIKKGIKLALEMKGYSVDPFQTSYNDQKGDSGDVLRYIDQDLFGYLIPIQNPKKRKAPVELSYLTSFYPIPTTIEFAGRFPKTGNPVPFEIEQAKFLGRFFGIIYNYFGIFHEDELIDDLKGKLKYDKNRRVYYLDKIERLNRIKVLLEILLLGEFKFPRSTNQLNYGNYRYVIVAFTKYIRPLPSFIDIRFEKEKEYEIIKKENGEKIVEKVIEKSAEGYQLDLEKIMSFVKLLEENEKMFIIDFTNSSELREFFARSNNTDRDIIEKVEVIHPAEVQNKIINNLEELLNIDNYDYYLNFYKTE